MPRVGKLMDRKRLLRQAAERWLSDLPSPVRHPCPYCPAKAGELCVTASGKYVSGWHRQRVTLRNRKHRESAKEYLQ